MAKREKAVHIEKFPHSSGFHVWSDDDGFIAKISEIGGVIGPEDRGNYYGFNTDPRYNFDKIIAEVESLSQGVSLYPRHKLPVRITITIG